MTSAMKFEWRYLLVLCLLPGFFVACSSSSTSGGSLTGVVWQLTDVKFDGQNTSNTVAQPDKFTIEFQTNGTANVKADCNMANLSYSINGDQLTIKAGPMTLVYCGPDSLSDQYLHALQQATSYMLQGDTLTINSGSNGNMKFKKS
jgi:heat shock protein HslJ